MSKDSKKPAKTAAELLGPVKDPSPAPEPPARDPLEVQMCKLVQAGGPSALTSLIRGSNRVRLIVAGNYGLTVTQEIDQGRNDTWFTPWSNVVWLRHG